MLDLSGRNRLGYEAAVMVPSGSATGAKLGFFKRLSSNTSTDFNSLYLRPGQEIGAAGSVGQGTGVQCLADRWYLVRVELDYTSLTMDVWIDSVRVIEDLPAATPGRLQHLLRLDDLRGRRHRLLRRCLHLLAPVRCG